MVIPEGYGQVNFIFSGDAAPTGAEVTFGVDMTEYLSSEASAAADIYTAYSDAGLNAYSVGACVLQTIRVKAGPSSTGVFGEYHPNSPGTAANPSTLVNGALLINKGTGRGGRQGRGRMFWPGQPDNQVTGDGTVSSGYLDSATEDFNAFLDKLGTANLAMVLLHGDHSPSAEPVLVNVLVPQPKLATQRRRLRR